MPFKSNFILYFIFLHCTHVHVCSLPTAECTNAFMYQIQIYLFIKYTQKIQYYLAAKRKLNCKRKYLLWFFYYLLMDTKPRHKKRGKSKPAAATRKAKFGWCYFSDICIWVGCAFHCMFIIFSSFTIVIVTQNLSKLIKYIIIFFQIGRSA